MQSTPSRFRLASQACCTFLRESPIMLGRPVIGKNTFVAITTSSRFAYSRRALPVTTSLSPIEYMFAVSKKLIPASTAARKKGIDSASSSTQGRHFDEP